MAGEVGYLGAVRFDVVSDTEPLERNLQKAQRQLRKLREEAVRTGSGIKGGFTDKLDDAEFKVRRLQTQLMRAREAKVDFGRAAMQTGNQMQGLQRGFEASATSLSGFASAFGGMSNQFGAFAGFGANILNTFMVGGPLLAGFTALAGAAGLFASKLIDVRDKAQEASEAAEKTQGDLLEQLSTRREQLEAQNELAKAGLTDPVFAKGLQRIRDLQLDISQAQINMQKGGKQLAAEDLISGSSTVAGLNLQREEYIKKQQQSIFLAEQEIDVIRAENALIKAAGDEADKLTAAEKARLEHVKELKKHRQVELKAFEALDKLREGEVFDLGTGKITGVFDQADQERKEALQEMVNDIGNSTDAWLKALESMEDAAKEVAFAFKMIDATGNDASDVFDKWVDIGSEGSVIALGGDATFGGDSGMPTGGSARRNTDAVLNFLDFLGSSGALSAGLGGDLGGAISTGAQGLGPGVGTAIQFFISALEKSLSMVVDNLGQMLGEVASFGTEFLAGSERGRVLSGGVERAGGMLGAGAGGAAGFMGLAGLATASGSGAPLAPILGVAALGTAATAGALSLASFTFEIVQGTEAYGRVQERLNDELKTAIDAAEPLAEQFHGLVTPIGPAAEGLVEIGVAVADATGLFPALFTGLKLFSLAVLNAAIFIKGSFGEDTSRLENLREDVYTARFNPRDPGGGRDRVEHRAAGGLERLADASNAAAASVSGIPRWFNIDAVRDRVTAGGETGGRGGRGRNVGDPIENGDDVTIRQGEQTSGGDRGNAPVINVYAMHGDTFRGMMEELGLSSTGWAAIPYSSAQDSNGG